MTTVKIFLWFVTMLPFAFVGYVFEYARLSFRLGRQACAAWWDASGCDE